MNRKKTFVFGVSFIATWPFWAFSKPLFGTLELWDNRIGQWLAPVLLVVIGVVSAVLEPQRTRPAWLGSYLGSLSGIYCSLIFFGDPDRSYSTAGLAVGTIGIISMLVPLAGLPVLGVKWVFKKIGGTKA